MRSLPNLAGQRVFAPSVQLSIVAADAGTTWVFSRDQITGLGSIVWECDFMGGLGKTAAYGIGLAASLPDIKAMLRDNGIVKGAATLRVDVGSSTFYPHVGTVRGNNRTLAQEIQLTIADRILDQDPLLPSVALTDSWATPHLEHLTDGEHWYYGKHNLPAYMSAVTSNVAALLGPRNISSANHVTSLWFCSDQAKGVEVNTGFQNILLTGAWAQQSGATNISSTPIPFEIKDGSQNRFSRWWRFENSVQDMDKIISGASPILNFMTEKIASDGFAQGPAQQINPAGGANYLLYAPVIQKTIPQNLKTITYITGVASFPQSTINTSGGSLGLVSLNLGNQLATARLAIPSFTGAASGLSGVGLDSTFCGFCKQFESVHAGSFTAAVSLSIWASVVAGGYKKFSIFAPQVSSADVAVSVNPYAILDHIHSWQTSIPYRQDQSSVAQVAVQSYAFCGYVGPKRAPWSALVQEFGQITGTYAWLGDSGMLNYRAYANSGAATVNASLSPNDYLSFRLVEAPIGSSVFEAEQLRKITGRWGYQHYDDKFAQSYVRTNSSNGVRNEREFTSKWIQDTVTASLWLNTLYARFNAGRLIAEFEVGPEHVDIELADVLWLEQPLIVGSASLFQVKRAELNLRTLTQKLTAVELVAR